MASPTSPDRNRSGVCAPKRPKARPQRKNGERWPKLSSEIRWLFREAQRMRPKGR